MKSKSNLRFSLPFPLAASIAAMLAAQSASATNLYWDVNGVTAGFSTVVGAWNDTNNFWNTDNTGGAGTVSAVTTSADDLFISQATTNTGSITLSGATKNASSITFLANVGPTTNITAGTIKIGGTGASSGIFAASSGANTVSSAIQLNSANTAFNFTNAGAGLLTIGAVTGTAAVTQTVTVGSSSTGGITLNGIIGNGGGGGNVALTLNSSGAGVATLAGANTYSGGTAVNVGTLVFRTLTSKSATGTHAFAAGTTLGMGVGTGGFTSADVDNAFSGTMVDNLSNVTVDSTTKVGLDTTVESFVHGNNIATTSRQLVKLGINDLTLTGTNDYTGGSSVLSGSLVFLTLASKPATGIHAFSAGTTLGMGVDGTEFTTTDVDNAFAGSMVGNLSNVTVDPTTNVGIDTTMGDLTYSTNVASVSRGLVKSGANILTLSGTNSAYTGATTVKGGTLRIASVAPAGANSSIGAFPTAGAAGLVLIGSTLDYTGPTASTNRGFTNSWPVSFGNSIINVATPGAKLTMGDFTQSGADITLTVNGGAGSSLDLGTYNYNLGQNQYIDTNIPVSLTAVSSTVVNGIFNGGPSLMTIGNASGTGFFLGSDTGAPILITGTVNFGATNLTNNQPTGTITYTGNSFTAGNVRMFNGNTFKVGGSGTLGTAGIYTGGIVFRGASIFEYNSSANQTISGNLSLSGADGGLLTMSGSGTLTLTGTNTVLGGVTSTTVTNGTLKYGKQVSLFNNLSANWTAAKLNVQTGGTLAFNVGGTGEFTTANVTTLLTNLAASSGPTDGMNAGSRFGFDTTNAAGGTFTIVDVIADSTGANGGARGLTKLGTNTLVLSGVNTYTGNTNVSAGTLELADNAQLKFVLGATSGINNSITGAGTATLNGDFNIDTTAADALPSGTWTLENVSSLSGAYGSTFTVVGFTNAGSDKWTKPNGPTTYTFDETTGILTLAAASGSAWDTWKAANAPGSNPEDDTDGDGVPNAVEFVLGGTTATKDLDKLPLAATGVTDMTFTFNRAVSSIDPKTALFIETSTDLVTWNTAPSPYTVPDTAIANNPGVTVVEDTSVGFDTVTLTVPKAPDAKKFARIKVVITP